MAKKAQKQLDDPNTSHDLLAKDMGKRIRRARIDSGLTQEELAQAIQRRQASVSDIENGKMEMTVVTLAMMANTLEKPISYFFPDWLMDVLQPEEMKPAEAELLSLAQRLPSEDLERITIQVRALVDRNKTAYHDWLDQQERGND